jgi:hypothetical protein
MLNTHQTHLVIAAYASLALSMVAIGFSGLQWYDAHRQNERTLQPLLSFSYDTDGREPNVGLSLLNAGQGPAILQSIAIYVDRVPVKSWDEATDYGKLPNDDLIHWIELDKGDPIRAGETVQLYWRTPKEGKKGLDQFTKFVDQRIGVLVTFCSVGGDCQSVCSVEGRC